MMGAALIVGWLFVGQAADADALKVEVPRLVKRLNADALADRDAAEARLVELGSPVLDLLPGPGARLSEEQRQRLARIKSVLERTTADASAEAAPVTLHGHMPLAKILQAIRQQTGNQVVMARQPGDAAAEPDLAVDFDKTPFWTAIDTVLDQTQLSVYPFGQPDRLQLIASPPGRAPLAGRVAVSGPLRIEATRVVARRDLRSTGSPLLMVAIEVAWEPRLRPIGLKQRMAAVKATDDAGRSLALEDPDAVKEVFPRHDATAVEMDIQWNLSATPVRRIASLKGALRAMVPGRVETFRFTDLLATGKRPPQRIAGATVTLQEVRKNRDNWELYVVLRYDDAGDSLESHRAWALMNEAYLEGPDGKRIAYESSETTQRSRNEIGMGYQFARDVSPEKLSFVYKAPGSIVTKDFAYELKDIPLP